MTYPKRILIARTFLGESQEAFGKRFGVKASAVSLWETGRNEAFYKVLYFVDETLEELRGVK